MGAVIDPAAVATKYAVATGASVARSLGDWFAGTENAPVTDDPFDFGAYSESDNSNNAAWFKRALTMPGNHADVGHHAHVIKYVATGSGKNGPASADYGLTIVGAKTPYPLSTAENGEIDGLLISMRQCGPTPTTADEASDSAAINVNAQMGGDCGFLTMFEGHATRINSTNPFATTLSMSAYIGTIDAFGGNPSATKYSAVSYDTKGFATTADTGSHGTAFYAGSLGSASWSNFLKYADDQETLFLVNGAGTQINMGATATRRSIKNNGGAFELLNGAGTPVQYFYNNGIISATGKIACADQIDVNGTKVIGARITGWGAPTGTADKTTFDTATVTLELLARRVKALIDNLTTHGLIGT